jgi:hypothetical protein
MANKTYLQLVNDVASVVGEATVADFSSPPHGISRIQEYINKVYKWVQTKRKWWWLESNTRIRLVADYITGTVSGTAGTATITGTGVDWSFLPTTTFLPGDLFQVDSETQWYQISSRAASVITLSTNLTDTLADATYRIVRLSYALPSNFRRARTVVYPHQNWELTPVDWQFYQALRHRRYNTIDVDDPNKFTVYGKDSSGNRLLWVDPAPDTARDLEITYQLNITQLAAVGDVHLIPEVYEDVLVFGAIEMYHTFGPGYDNEAASAASGQKFEILGKMMDEQDSFDVGDVRLAPDTHDMSLQYRQIRGRRYNEATLKVAKEML